MHSNVQSLSVLNPQAKLWINPCHCFNNIDSTMNNPAHKLRFIRHILVSLILASMLSSCSGPEGSIEEQIAALVADAEVAAESRSIDFFDEHLVAQYSDAHGNSRKDLLRTLTGYFFRNRSIYLVTRTREVTVDENGVHALVFVGMAGSPDIGFDQLAGLRGDLYRLELSFTPEAPHQLRWARWQRAAPREVFSDE
jgi:hypothetical protein